LSVKPETILAIEVGCASTSDRLLVASETEHGKRNRNGNVDAKLTGLELLLKQCSRCTGTSEDSSAVAVRVGVDEVDGIFCGLNIEADEDRAEDLLGVASHVRFDIRDDCWTDLEGLAGYHGE
jgi:hypothetical protein